MLMFVISMLILEVLNLVITDYKYREWRRKEEAERSENTGVIPYIPRDAFGDVYVNIVLYWRKGRLSFFMRCVAVCQGCLAVILVIYGGYNIHKYPSFVTHTQRLRFCNVQLDDLIKLLASLLVLCGSTSLLVSLQGISMTCVTSRAAYYVSAFLNNTGVVISVTAIIFFGVFITEVRENMDEEVEELFYASLNYEPYFSHARDLILQLSCCGIRRQQDLHLISSSSWYRLYPLCTDFRPCVPVLEEHFQTFSGASLSLVTLTLILQIFSLLYVNKRVRDLTDESTDSDTSQVTPVIQTGIVGILKRRVKSLWEKDKYNGVGIALKIITMFCGLCLVVTGLLLRFDDIFDDIELHDIFYNLSFNNRRFTYYIEALWFGMLGLGITEMIITLFGCVIYCWDAKFLESISIVLRGALAVAVIVIIGLCIETKSNIDWTMYDQLLQLFFNRYVNSGEDSGTSWEKLFFKMQCCGVGNYGDFEHPNLQFRQISIYCCKNVTRWYPGLEAGSENCTNDLYTGTFYETGCNDTLLDRFGGYMITFLCLLSFLLAFQVFNIVFSVRRIRVLEPGHIIDKQISILVESVKRKCRRDTKITDSSEGLVTAGPSESQSDPILRTPEDMKRNTLLPSLDDKANTTTPPASKTIDDTTGRGNRRKDKGKRKQNKSVHTVEVHRSDSTEQDKHSFVPLQGRESSNIGLKQNENRTTGKRHSFRPPTRSSTRSGRASETQDQNFHSTKTRLEDNVRLFTEAGNTKSHTNETKKTSQRVDGDAHIMADKIAGNSTGIEPNDKRTSTTKPDDNMQRSVISGDKTTEAETEKREQIDKQFPGSTGFNLDHNNLVIDKENEHSDLGDNDTKEKYSSNSPLPMMETLSTQTTSSQGGREDVLSEKQLSTEIRQENTERAVKVDTLHRNTEDRNEFGVADLDGEMVTATNRFAENLDDSGRAEKVVGSGTPDRLDENGSHAEVISEELIHGNKINKEVVHDVTVDKTTKINDFPDVYEDDFSDESDGNNDTEAIDFFNKIAGN
ncbi:uncharacterized protein LOC132559273 [Ylistrum balloti]|uniref:uncharacterized protein LOC132559273 n=1 Tax=Ylistrum balloti TaxID=509963 RepID=UPI002905F1C7|nr:uncharacterized protein LOC132559273 [Ylistrum balloti]